MNSFFGARGQNQQPYYENGRLFYLFRLELSYNDDGAMIHLLFLALLF